MNINTLIISKTVFKVKLKTTSMYLEIDTNDFAEYMKILSDNFGVDKIQVTRKVEDTKGNGL